MLRKWCSTVCLLSLSLVASFVPAHSTELPALHVEKGQIVAAGKPVRLRGINWGWWHLAGTQYTESDMQKQAAWGANVARLAFSYTDLEDDAHPGVWKEDGFRQMDEVIQWGKRHGQYIILDMHVAPGGQDPAQYVVNGQNKIWADTASQERFLNLWKEIARRYRNKSEVAAYELMNEPETTQKAPDALCALYQRAITAVRTVDSKKVLVVAGDHWSPARFLVDGMKMPDPNILYTFHFYEGYGESHWVRNLKDGPGLSGTRDWVKVEEKFTIPTDVVEITPMLRSSTNSGTAWFDDVRLETADGKVVQSQTFDKGTQDYRAERHPVESMAYDPTVGHDKLGSLRVKATPEYNGWVGSRVNVQPGQEYHFSAWVKLDNATGDTYLTASFAAATAPSTKDDLRKKMAPARDFAKKFNVPVWVGEFGCPASQLPAGSQTRWVNDCISLFEENASSGHIGTTAKPPAPPA